MSRLEEAQQKLETALSKLDAAIDERLSDSAHEGGGSEAALVAVRAEKDRLEGTTNAVATQLDRTIERLQKLLQD